MGRGGTVQEPERRDKDHNKSLRGAGENQGVPGDAQGQERGG